jgi:hypothetical protein
MKIWAIPVKHLKNGRRSIIDFPPTNVIGIDAFLEIVKNM